MEELPVEPTKDLPVAKVLTKEGLDNEELMQKEPDNEDLMQKGPDNEKLVGEMSTEMKLKDVEVTVEADLSEEVPDEAILIGQ